MWQSNDVHSHLGYFITRHTGWGNLQKLNILTQLNAHVEFYKTYGVMATESKQNVDVVE